MRIVLHKVNNNLNRVYRTAEFFGVKEIVLHKCKAFIKGNLFKSKGNVTISFIEDLPKDSEGIIFFETDAKKLIHEVDLTQYHTFVFGGESNDLPKKYRKNRAVIPKVGEISGLTVENAVGIVLYELSIQLRKKGHEGKNI